MATYGDISEGTAAWAAQDIFGQLSGWYLVYAENEPHRRWLASTRRKAEWRAFLVGLRTMWPNPLNAQRVVIERIL